MPKVQAARTDLQEAIGATTRTDHPGETRTPMISLDLGRLVPDQVPPAGVGEQAEVDTEGTTIGTAIAAETDPLSIVIRTHLDSTTEAHLVIAMVLKGSVTEATGRNTTTDRTSDRSSSLTSDSPASALKVRHGTATILEDHGSALISDQTPVGSRSVDLPFAAPAAKTESGTAGNAKEVAAMTVLPSTASIVALNKGRLDHLADNMEINGGQITGGTISLDPTGKTGDARQRRPM